MRRFSRRFSGVLAALLMLAACNRPSPPPKEEILAQCKLETLRHFGNWNYYDGWTDRQAYNSQNFFDACMGSKKYRRVESKACSSFVAWGFNNPAAAYISTSLPEALKKASACYEPMLKEQ
jgi:hypothetical protein